MSEAQSAFPARRSFADRHLPIALAAIAGLVLYLPALPGGFLSDDYSLLHTFYGASPPEIVSRIATMFISGVGPPSNQYRPLTMASFALNALASGPDPVAWRLVNIVLHAANAALVALLAIQLVPGSARHVRWAAFAAGVAFAWLPTSAEAVAWIASRFDGMALMWILISVCAYLQSRTSHDRWAIASLVAMVLAFMSKESAAIGPLIIVALAWARARERRGFVRDAAGALIAASPWLAIIVFYAALRLWLFGDAVRFFPGSSPAQTLVTGKALAALLDFGDWWALAVPDDRPRRLFDVATVVLAVCAVAASVADRALGRIVVATSALVFVSLALLLASHGALWPLRGEGGRLLYPIAAIAAVALMSPLAARSGRLRIAASIVVALFLASEFALARAAVDRRARAGSDMQALVAAIGHIADTAPPGSFAFVVVPDHLGSIVFARNAQGALMIPPVQPRSLESQLLVQTTRDVPAWPQLLPLDVVGSLKRGSPAHPSDGSGAVAFALPDRYLCWSPRTHSMVALGDDFGADLRSWTARWNAALDANGCAG